MKTKPLAFPSVADTEAGPEIRWASGDLTVEFRDWQGVAHSARFIDVPHFELLGEGELDSAMFACDGAVEVSESPLIGQLAGPGAISDANDYRHLVIGFNEIGSFLVVICRDFNMGEAYDIARGQD